MASPPALADLARFWLAVSGRTGDDDALAELIGRFDVATVQEGIRSTRWKAERPTLAFLERACEIAQGRRRTSTPPARASPQAAQFEPEDTSAWPACPDCDGEGKVRVEYTDGTSGVRSCHDCSGLGRVPPRREASR